MGAGRGDQFSDDELRRRRVKAAWIDMAVMVALELAFLLAFGTSNSHRFTNVVEGRTEHTTLHVRDLSVLGAFAALAAILLYFFLTELITGQTLGKHLMGVRVIAVSGARPRAAAILIRTLGRLIDWWPFCYWLGWAVAYRSHGTPQRIGDRLAGTTVALDRKPRP